MSLLWGTLEIWAVALIHGARSDQRMHETWVARRSNHARAIPPTPVIWVPQLSHDYVLTHEMGELYRSLLMTWPLMTSSGLEEQVLAEVQHDLVPEQHHVLRPDERQTPGHHADHVLEVPTASHDIGRTYFFPVRRLSGFRSTCLRNPKTISHGAARNP